VTVGAGDAIIFWAKFGKFRQILGKSD